MTTEAETSLAKHPFLAGAPPEAIARLAAQTRVLDAPSGATVITTEDASTDVYLVLRGDARVEALTPGGKEVILADMREGEVLGELAALDGHPRSATVVALTRLRLAVVPAPAFAALLDDAPAVRHRLLATLASRLRAVSARLMEHDSLPVRHRLQGELLRLARPRPGGGLAVSPPPTRAELGARINARREAVSREMAEMLRQGVLEETRGAIVLRDPEALRAAYRAALAGGADQ